MHRYTADTERLAQAVLDYASRRMRLDPVPLDGPKTLPELTEQAGQTITEDGLGGEQVLKIFDEVLARACISIDHPRYLSFIPSAPTEASTLFDLVVGASSIYGGSWLEGSGAVYAENQALRWIADLAGFPAESGGVFVQGGTLGNLSALVAARHAAQELRGGARPLRWKLACSAEAHSSIASAARVMDIDLLSVPVDERGRLTGEELARVLDEDSNPGDVFAVVATAGTTNFGIVDDLAGVADVAAERGLWLHVDGAYGLAALAAPSARPLFEGIERADSFIVDPHKWLFAPFDACALVYRDPAKARAAHTQSAGYLDVINSGDEWNPSDYAYHLSRRARGLPFWFSLASHGTRAYADAIESTLTVARAAADEVRSRTYVELLREPDLTVVVFRRIGWTPREYHQWSERIMAAHYAFVVPTSHEGETVTRFAVVNPRTTLADVQGILDTMA